MMKRIIAIALTVLMLVAIVGCSSLLTTKLSESTTNTLAATTVLHTTATTQITTSTSSVATTKTTTASSTDLTTKATTEKPATTAYKSTLISMTTPISPGEIATLKIKGKPSTVYDINVYYSTVKSSASGLENKTSDADGNVSWTWKVGSGTNPGNYHIDVIGAGSTLVVNFTVK